jgi:hypothetical protein
VSDGVVVGQPGHRFQLPTKLVRSAPREKFREELPSVEALAAARDRNGECDDLSGLDTDGVSMSRQRRQRRLRPDAIGVVAEHQAHRRDSHRRPVSQ